MKALALVLVVCCSSFNAHARNRIWFWKVNNDPYWNSVERYFSLAAEKLDITVQTYSAEGDLVAGLAEFKKKADKNKFDLVIFQSSDQLNGEFLDHSDQKGIPVIALGLQRNEIKQENQQLVAYIYPKNKEGGLLQAEGLYKLGKEKFPKGRLKFAAVLGPKEDGRSQERLEGLNQWASKQTDVDLLPLIDCPTWNRKEARGRIARLWRRAGDIQIIWAAESELAYGVLEAAKEVGKKPGKDFVLGGFGLDKMSIENVEKGIFALTTVGAQLSGLMGAVVAYDYFKGFKSENKNLSIDLSVVTKVSGKEIGQKFLTANLETIDLKHLTKADNPELLKNGYNFKLDNMKL